MEQLLLLIFTVSSHLLYDATSDFCACVSGWLCCEIVRHTVDHDCFTNDLIYGKSVCFHGHICTSVAFQQRRQITAMLWVWGICRIIMLTRVREVLSCTASSFVDMESEETRFRIGQIGYVCIYDNVVFALIEFYFTKQVGSNLSSVNLRYCVAVWNVSFYLYHLDLVYATLFHGVLFV